ncbi:hypothetical protein [Lysobacter sp. F6437]|uniref:hypothetical protein n=1 Tax=Lysobacter sp. F6437 TaxID=3459296 RepID=UPI00403E168A
MGRTILAVVAGVVVAWLTIMLCQFGSAALHPPPPGMDLTDPSQLAIFIRAAPPAAMALVVAGWALGALIGGWLAARISRRHPRAAAVLVGAVVLAGVIANAMMIPHPLWMTIAGVLLPLPAAWLGARLGRPHPQATPSL